MAEIRHLAFPLRLTADGSSFVTVEQDSDADIEGCMATILLWPLGTRELDPDFGTPDEAFVTGGADLQEIRDALLRSEPRATNLQLAQDDNALVRFVSSIRVGWAP